MRKSTLLVLLAGAGWPLWASLGAPRPDIVINDVAVYPESMSAASDGTVYIGSIKGIVFRAAARSAHADPWILPTPENGLLSLLGVLTDERSNTLWVCSSPNPFRSPPAVGTAALVAFDLKRGTRRASYPFPAPASVCNDITVASDGTVYATDTPNGRIFRLARGTHELAPFAEDPRLKGIDGIVFGGDGTLYLNIVTRNQLMRIERTVDGKFSGLTELTLSQPVGAPDGFRLIRGHRFLLAEGSAGRIDEVTIEGDRAAIRPLREGLIQPPAVTWVGHTAYALEGKIGYLIDPKLKGQDPGPFKAYAVPLD